MADGLVSVAAGAVAVVDGTVDGAAASVELYVVLDGVETVLLAVVVSLGAVVVVELVAVEVDIEVSTSAVVRFCAQPSIASEAMQAAVMAVRPVVRLFMLCSLN